MKRGTPEHPKTRRLAELLGVSLPCAIGMLELLWHWCARFTPCGDIGKYPDEAIEAAMFWTGPPGFAIKSLKKSGWLEKSCSHRLVVHDWEQHCDQSVRKLLARNHWGFATSMSGHLPDMDILPKPKPEPKPLPEPEPKPDTQATVTIVEPAEEAAPPNGCVSEKPPARLGDFELWWARWSSVRGTNHRLQALHVWFFVKEHHLHDCYECTESYLASLDNPAKGYNPENFLRDQLRDGFKARWPPKRAGPVSFADQRKQAANREFERRLLEEVQPNAQRKIQSG